jgi:hypothetical protein
LLSPITIAVRFEAKETEEPGGITLCVGNLEASVWAPRGEHMARLRFTALVLVVLAVAAPSGAGGSSEAVGCAGTIPAGGTASCVSRFQIPHFDAGDAIDYETLVARIVSPQAFSWKVHAKIADAKGKTYFAWECVVRRSTVAGDSSAYVDRTCQAWRKTVAVKHHGETTHKYYTADTSKPQLLTVTAWVGGCAPSGTAGCRFEAAANYLLAG